LTLTTAQAVLRKLLDDRGEDSLFDDRGYRDDDLIFDRSVVDRSILS
jgi:hypothetical protein